MPGQLAIPIWRNSINFKVYRYGRDIEYEHLLRNLGNYKGDVDERRPGWVIDKPYFEIDGGDRNDVCFVYISFKRNANASQLEGKDIFNTDPTACVFNFKDKLITVSTTDARKLANTIERKAFEPIHNITENIGGIIYSNDFLVWMIYIYNKKNGFISDDIKIEDLTAITSGRERANLSGAIKANTQVIEHPEAKVILGYSGIAQGVRLVINSSDVPYMFNLYSDGRINARLGQALDDIKDKAMYASQIHEVTQKCFTTYSEFIDNGEWDDLKIKYRISLLEDAIEMMRRSLTG